MSNDWYVRIGGQEYGPCSGDELRQYASDGKIDAQTEVKKGIDGQWVAAEKVKGLFAESPPSPPKAPDLQPVKPAHLSNVDKREGQFTWLDVFTFRRFATPIVIHVIWFFSLLFVTGMVTVSFATVVLSYVPHRTSVDVKTTTTNGLSKVTAHNSGKYDAGEVLVLVTIPEGTTVLNSYATVGKTKLEPLANGGNQLQWKIGHLKASERETLTLRTESKVPGKLDITWDYSSTTSGQKPLSLLTHLLCVLGSLVYLLLVRLTLEAIVILFRIEEHLRPS